MHTTVEDHEGEPLSHSPCEDKPISPQLSAARLLPSGVALEPVLAFVFAAILWDSRSIQSEESLRVVRLAFERDRPPDELARLRSVILVV
ncbi:MAG: hypothetical protein IT432_14210 [Phycisphaerales bacterium]|nr:hypothetical protein [Phycisphaerales bacterium]